MRLLPASAAVAAVALVAMGCGHTSGDDGRTPARPAIGVKGDQKAAAQDLGFPTFATKNTTRIGGADPVADAAGAAQAVYSGTSKVTRPRAVALVDVGDWRGAVAASVLMSSPIRAPLLFSKGGELPQATQDALTALDPTGSKQAGGAEVIRVGEVPRTEGRRTTDLRGQDPFALARAIDAFQAAARGTTSDRVVIASAEDPAYAMPAAGWAAKSGDPVLFTHRDSLPRDTAAAIAAHQQPKIYVLGPPSAVSEKVVRALRKLGTVQRISGNDPVTNSIAFARFVDGPFGWGVVDPGPGLVFVNRSQPLAEPAVAPLAGAGTYGPMLVLDDPKEVPKPLSGYLLDIQPGYRKDPVRGVYNHGWVIGDERAVSAAAQARLDALLEIVPVERTRSTS